jgi:hypothetical protein
MPYSGQTRVYDANTANEITYHLCDHCGQEWESEDGAEDCCRYYCHNCGAAHSYEEDALDCCAYYCDDCGERYDSAAEAEDCAEADRRERGEDHYDDPYEPEAPSYPQEILDTVVEYPIFIPEIPGRPARLCSVEQELSSGGTRAAKLLHDIGIAVDPYIANYSHGGHPGRAIVKGDGSLPAGGAEVVYSRFNLSDRSAARNFSDAIWRLREMKKQLLVSTSRQAGLHIHVSALGVSGDPSTVFGPREMASLYEIWSFCEDVIFKLGSAGWESHRGTSYTAPMPKFMDAPSAGRIVQNLGGNRYYSLNFQRLLGAAQQCRCGACAVGDWTECNCGSLQAGTIEWRVFNASTKPETIHGWLILAHALTAKAFDHQLGSLPEPNGYQETEQEKHQWIFGWILNECPLDPIERLVLIGLAKRSPGLLIDWEDFERTNADWMVSLTDELDDELSHDAQELTVPVAQPSLWATPPTPPSPETTWEETVF